MDADGGAAVGERTAWRAEEIVRAAHAPGGVHLRTRTRWWILSGIMALLLLGLIGGALVTAAAQVLAGQHPKGFLPVVPGLLLLGVTGLVLAHGAWSLSPWGPNGVLLDPRGLRVRHRVIGWDELAEVRVVRLEPMRFGPFARFLVPRESVGIDLTEAGWARMREKNPRVRAPRGLTTSPLLPLNPFLEAPPSVLAEAMQQLRRGAAGPPA